VDAVQTLINVLVPLLTALMIYWLVRRETNKSIERSIDRIKEEFQPTISKAFGQLGVKGADAKAIKQIEQMVAEDVNANVGTMFPEVELILGWLSPETLERMKEHPESLPILLQRYGPLIAQFAGKLRGQGKNPEKGFDF